MKFIWIFFAICLSFLNLCFGTEKVGEKGLSPKQVSALVEPLKRAGANSKELRRAIERVSDPRVEGMVFLIEHMPNRDLKTLSSEYLIENVNYAYKARSESDWAKSVPQEIFFNDVLPYASINERRDRWRKDFHTRFSPLVKGARTLEEAAQILNKEIWKMIDVRYHARKRPKPDQSPYESIDAGFASCTGLSVLLIDACRSVGVPSRFVGTPMWANKRGNHSWVEIWDGNSWQFTGACEYSAAGLGHAWFKGSASKAIKEDPKHAIYATSWKQTKTNFPLIWDLGIDYVFAENVTDNYTGNVGNRVFIQIFDRPGGERIATDVEVWMNGTKVASGRTRDSTNDTNDMLELSLRKGTSYVLKSAFKKDKGWSKSFSVNGGKDEEKQFFLSE